MKPGSQFSAFAATGIRTAHAPRRGASARLMIAAGLAGFALAALEGGGLLAARLLLVDHHVRGEASAAHAPAAPFGSR